MAELVEAAKSGDLARVRLLLGRPGGGCDVNFRCPPDGSTALYWAACGGHAPVCDWLIGCGGADVGTATTKSGSTALHGSADRGHHDCVDLLVKRGSDVNVQTTTNGDTALHLAAYRGHLDVCRLLVANDADASIVNRQGRTALEEAKIKGHGDVCRLLALLLSRQRRQDFSHFAKSYSAELSDDKIPSAEEKLSVEFFRDDLGLDLHHHHRHHHRPDALGGPSTPLSFAAGAHPHRPRSTTGRLFDDPGPKEEQEEESESVEEEGSARQLNRLRLRVSALESYAGALETRLRLRDGSLDRLRAENAELRRQLLETTGKPSAATQQEAGDELCRLRRQTDECAARTEQAIRELDDTRRRYRQLESVVFGPTDDKT